MEEITLLKTLKGAGIITLVVGGLMAIVYMVIKAFLKNMLSDKKEVTEAKNELAKNLLKIGEIMGENSQTAAKQSEVITTQYEVLQAKLVTVSTELQAVSEALKIVSKESTIEGNHKEVLEKLNQVNEQLKSLINDRFVENIQQLMQKN